jgi:hypothetical protein
MFHLDLKNKTKRALIIIDLQNQESAPESMSASIVQSIYEEMAVLLILCPKE